MSLSTLKSDLLALESAISAGSVKDILSAGGAVIQDASELWGLFAAAPEDDADKAECEACCQRIHAQCTAVAATPEPVGKLGDGELLKQFLALLVTLLPLILKKEEPPAA